jgi:hypothetical protein
MKTIKKILLTLTILLPMVGFSQEGQGLKHNAKKIIIGVNVPLGGSCYYINLHNKMGMYGTLYSPKKSGVNNQISITDDHKLIDSYVVNKKAFCMGATYNLWKPFQAYCGVGLGWGSRQLVYEDTLPFGGSNAYRTESSGAKPLVDLGIIWNWWRMSFGMGYNTYMNTATVSFGYVIKTDK